VMIVNSFWSSFVNGALPGRLTTNDFNPAFKAARTSTRR
jgi:hypothetical protein